jgi:hypothetical protein
MSIFKASIGLVIALSLSLVALEAASAAPTKFPFGRCIPYITCCPPGHPTCLQ